MLALVVQKAGTGLGSGRRLSSSVCEPFFTLKRWDIKGIVVPDTGPQKFFMKLHHPSLPGEDMSPADRDVYKCKLRTGAPVLVDSSGVPAAYSQYTKDQHEYVNWFDRTCRILEAFGVKQKSDAAPSHRWMSSVADGDSWHSSGLVNAQAHSSNIGTIIGTLKGPGAKPMTHNVLQDGPAGELIRDVDEKFILAGARERVIMGPLLLPKELEWEVRLMWPADLEKVSFEIDGQLQAEPIGISKIRAGKLLIRIREPCSDQDIFVPCRADPNDPPSFFASLFGR